MRFWLLEGRLGGLGAVWGGLMEVFVGFREVEVLLV